MRSLKGILVAGVLLGPPVARAHDVGPGLEYFVLSSGSQQFLEGPYAIPAGFFGPGSDPLTGGVPLVGIPILSGPACPEPLGATCVVIGRNSSSSLPCCPGSATVATEVLALSLASAEPIMVTYAGGSPEPWNMRLSLSASAVPAGLSTLQHLTPSGGTFACQLPFALRFEFQKAGPLPPPPLVIDFGLIGVFESFDLADVPWSHAAPSTILHTSCEGGFYAGIENEIGKVGFSSERSNRYAYFLTSSPENGPTPVTRSTWGNVKAIYR